MIKISIYESGERYVVDDAIGMGIWGGNVVEEIDMSNATETELQELRIDPYNNGLIDEIRNRG